MKSENRRKNEEYLAFAEGFMKKQNQQSATNNSAVSSQKTVMVMDDGSSNNEFESTQILNDEAHNDNAFSNLKTELFFDDLPISVGASSVIGKRQYQQDSVMIPDEKKIMSEGKTNLICVLSDGMGGLSGGEIASDIATKTLFNDYYNTVWNSHCTSYMEFFNKEAEIVNEKILALTSDNGEPMHAGATLIAVAVNDNEMNFLNIGDSRIYLVRDGNITQLTHDQNYLSILMEKVKSGEITKEEALSHPKREALVSYCGIKELKIKEMNLRPVQMKSGDMVLMCSDGLYRLLSEAEMLNIVCKTSNDMNLAAYKLTAAATNKNHRGQDNTSVILIKFN